MSEWTNEQVLEFINLYETEEVIWNPKHHDHKNRNLVGDAWKRIASTCSKKCTVEELKKKKDSLMSIFRPLHLKEKNSSKSGAATEDLYRPTWFAYKAMSKFLGVIYQPRSTINTEALNVVDKAADDNNEEEKDIINQCSLDGVGQNTSLQTSSGALKEQTKLLQRKRKGTPIEIIEKRFEDAYSIMKKASEKPPKDTCALYCELLCKKLADFDEETRDILMNDIDNLVFKAKMAKRGTTTISFSSPDQSFLASPCYIHVNSPLPEDHESQSTNYKNQ